VQLFYLVLVLVIISSCCPLSCRVKQDSGDTIYSSIRSEARQYRFRFVLWEVQALTSLITDRYKEEDDEAFKRSLRSQIETVLHENSIAVFPPLQFRIEEPPHLLVISPRDRIVYANRLLLSQQLSLDDMEMIEAQVAMYDVSSLVVELGGFGATYPPIVTDGASIRFIIDAVVEEWLHQYLAFKPLGFRYLLDSIGITQHPDVIVLNESLAGMVSEEIGAEVYNRYYNTEEKDTAKKEEREFDFDAEMRETRKQVDLYLSMGKIEVAEQYMEARRQVFVAHGYHIRKLNQAYFAFHGIYGDDPASVSPIYAELEQLRSKSPSLKDFLEIVSSMTEYSDLQKALVE
jgi:hypothetical protein